MVVVASDTGEEVPASETVIDLCIIEIEDQEVAEEVEVISEVVIEEVVALEEMDPDIWDSIEIDPVTEEMGPEKEKLLINSSPSKVWIPSRKSKRIFMWYVQNFSQI